MIRPLRRAWTAPLAVCLSADLALAQSPSPSPSAPPPEQFDNIRVLIPRDEKRADEADASVVFQEDRLVVRSARLPRQREVEYRFINSAVYSYSSRPKLLATGAAALVLGPLALPMLFMKSKKHWLTVQAGAQSTVLRLDKGNFRSVIAAYERRSGRKVEIARK